jgi:RHS repeat-associated protein
MSRRAVYLSSWSAIASGARILKEGRGPEMRSFRPLPLTARMLLLALLGAACAATPAAAQVVEYYHLDAIGNVRAVSDASGAVVERHDYLPFGEECTTGACASNPQLGAGTPRKFTGKERDAETGLDYFGARYYGSKIARFTTTDPAYTMAENVVDPQRWNRYAYVRNNPLRYTDPDGRELRLSGDTEDAVATLKAGVPEGDRGHIQAVTRDGHVVIDARAMNDGASSQSENFKALRQIANSPGAVELNTSSQSFTVSTTNGDRTVAFAPGIHGYTETRRRPASVYVNPNETVSEKAAAAAHELRHARRHLLGQAEEHEFVDRSKTQPDPKGAVNLESKAAADEARRNAGGQH